MDLKKAKKIMIYLIALYLVFAIGIYIIAFDQFRYAAVTGTAPSADFWTGEIVEGTEVQQTLAAPADLISGIDIYAGTYGRENTGSLSILLQDESGNPIVQKSVDVSDFLDSTFTSISFDQQVSVTPGELLTLRLTASGCYPENAITVYGGNTFLGDAPMAPYRFNGEEQVGFLCVRLNGYNDITFYKTYLILAASVFLLLLAYMAHCWKAMQNGKVTLLAMLLSAYMRYSFLLKQLVSRDFKTKYKRSALGMAWSFMNPLLTMSVQYVVFSTIFKSNVPNYPVYLLTGIVFFSFFNEAVSMGMTSITQNAALIKKVYMPKFIYPVSRILSSLVNFGFALIPLFIMIIVTGTPLRLSMLLVFFDILCLLAFITGITLLLTTAMTFFQDTQFLWTVFSMMWMYLTPVFYPESIISANLLPIYRLNPMYQFISFARTCITGGISPAPKTYFFCLFYGIAVLVLGLAVFRKHQDKFVLYL